MIKKIYQIGLLSALMGMGTVAFAKSTITLTPARNLDINTVNQVANNQVDVAVNAQAHKNVQAGFDTVLQAALNSKAVYGLTVGVGWNKDKPVFSEVQGQRVLSPELLALSKQFNRSSLRAHSSGLGKAMPVTTVRTAMLIRLNTFLNGEAGVSPEVVKYYLAFLNNGITPIVPETGTVGEADITLSAHIGLAMVGEWDVMYKGKRQKSATVLKQIGLKPLEPVGKDFLSILSNNALMSAQAIQAYNETKSFYQKEVNVFVLALEGLNGNVAPLSDSALGVRPYPHVLAAAEDIRKVAAGSDLWKVDAHRALQDPLSYRSMVYTMGDVKLALSDLERNLLIQINHSDDNPVVLINGLSKQDDTEQMQQYLVGGHNPGAIVPTSNFNFVPVTRSIAQMNESLAKLAEIMTQQTLRFENPDLTKLPRFLASKENNGHAFGAIQKPFVAVNQMIKQLAQPQWFESVTLAGNIEDTASMSGQALKNHQQIMDGLYDICAYQMLHAAQAVNLRTGFTQGPATKKLLDNYRKEVDFVKLDTVTTPIIEKTILFLR